MHRRDRTPFLIWLCLLVTTVLTSGMPKVAAQIVPDTTLGPGNNSVVSPNPDILNRSDITGGLRLNSALFHSFQQFNVGNGLQVYFANPSGIQNIFSRVTGGDLSRIDGMLGVAGAANLFLMNPNGIVFGPNARLDVSGSFLATTARAVEFSDGQIFAASGDRAVPLVEVNIPIGLQFGATPPAMLRNEGNLAVNPGQSLSLVGGITTSTGSLVAPGGTVQVLGQQVRLMDQARIDVSAPYGGGTVLVGGNYQGKGGLLNATQTFVGPGVVINADALTQGNGGRVIVWADGSTRFQGTITARGGASGGDGGFVEVSGKNTLNFQGTVNVLAPNGSAGTILLDPATITIVAVPPGSVDLNGDGTTGDDLATADQLDDANADFSGANSIISSTAVNSLLGSGSLTLAANTSITVSSGTNISIPASRTLTLNALTVNLDAPIAYADPTTSLLTGNPQTINVNPTGNVQNGIDVAANNAILNVTTGTYNQSASVNKPLSIAFNGAGSTLTGDFTTTGGNAVTLSGNLTTNGNQTYGGAVTLNGATALTGTTLTFNNTVSAGGNNLTLSGNEIDLANTVSSTGSALTLQPVTPGQNIALAGTNNATSALDLTNTELGQLQGFSSITIGRSNGSGAINLNGDITLNAALTLQTPSGGSVTTTGSDLKASRITITAGGNINLGAVEATASLGGGSIGESITVTSGGTLQLQGAIQVVDFDSLTLRGSTITANLGTNAITARSGDVNLLANTINLNQGTINVSGIGTKPDGGNVRIGGSLTGTILSNANAISVDGAPAFRIEAGADAGGNEGEVFLFANSPTNISSILNNSGIVVPQGRVNINQSNIDLSGGPGGFTNITVTNGNSVAFGGVNYSQLFFDVSGNHLYLAETFLEALTTVSLLRANNQFTINPLTTDRTLRLGNLSQISAGRTFTMNASDTITRPTGDLTIVVGNATTLDPAASLTVGSINTPGGNISLASAGTINIINNTLGTDPTNLTTGGGDIRIAGRGGVTIAGRTNFTTRGGVVDVQSFDNNLQMGNATAPSTVNTSFSNNPGGNITFAATGGNVAIKNTEIISNNAGSGNGFSSIKINSADGSVDLTEVSISAANQGLVANPRFAGDVLVNAKNRIDINRSLISTNGREGRIIIGSSIQSATGLKPQTILIDQSTLTTSNGNLGGAVNSGDIIIRAENTVNSAQPGIELRNTKLSTNTEGTGVGGQMILRSPVTAITSSSLSAETTGSGKGGSILVGRESPTDPNTLTFATSLTLDSSRLIAQTGGSGEGGSIDIKAESAGFSNDSILNAGVSATGTGGTIAIATNGGSLTLNNSQISTAISSTGTGNGRTTNINTGTLSLQNGARIQSQTEGTGKAGDIQINVTNTFTATGRNSFGRFSGVLASSEGLTSGEGGSITINNNTAPIGQLTLSENAFLAANTRSNQDGGDISINVETLELKSGGQILTAALEGSGGKAGSITVNATRSVSIADAVSPPTFSSPFDTLAVVPLNDLSFQSIGSPAGGGFAYYSFNVAAGNSSGTFDIDGGFKLGSGSIDTQLFLFNRTTGQLLAENDDSITDPGSQGLLFASLLTRDSFINHTFSQPGSYVIGVGAFPSFVTGTAPIRGSVPTALQTYTLNVSLSNPGTGGTSNPTNLNPNIQQDGSNLFASGLYASSRGSGNAGSVTITTPDLKVENQGVISASNLRSTGEDITLQGLNTLKVTGGGNISTATDSGVAGNVQITATQGSNPSIQLDNSTIAAAASQTGGVAGAVRINTPTLILENQAKITASNIGPDNSLPVGSRGGTSDDIQLQGLNTLTLRGGSSITAETKTGTAGSVSVNLGGPAAQSIQLTGQNTLVSAQATEAGGTGGSVTLNAVQLTVQDQAKISASNIASSTGGNIGFQNLDTLQVLSGGTIEAKTTDGVAGNVEVAANTSVNLNQGRISVQADGIGQAGTLTVKTPTLTLDNNGNILASTNSGGIPGRDNIVLSEIKTLTATNNSLISSSTDFGNAGNVKITVDQGTNPSIRLNSSTIEAAANQPGGQAGKVEIATPTLKLENNSTIAASNAGPNAGGTGGTSDSVILKGVTSSNQVMEQLDVTNSKISASATGMGTAGNVEVTALNITLDQDAAIQTNNVAARAPGQNEEFGNVKLQGVNRLTVAGGSQVTASTQTGTAGDVRVTGANGNPAQSVVLNGLPLLRNAQGVPQVDGNQQPLFDTSKPPSSSFTGLAATAEQGGNAGGVSVSAVSLTIANGASIEVNSRKGSGTAGEININATTLDLSDASQIAAETNQGGKDRPANINLRGLQTLTVNRSLISSSTDGGRAGSVTVEATGPITLTGTSNLFQDSQGNPRGGIVAEATGGGNAGQVKLTTPTLQLTDRASVAASSSNGSGTAGGVEITANTVNLSQSARIAAETDQGGAGKPANITLQNLQTLTVDSSLISSSTNSGTAGSVTVNASGPVTLTGTSALLARGNTPPRGGIVAEATSGGDAGSVTINTPTLTITNAASVAVSSSDGAGTAGDVTITARTVDLTNAARISAETDRGGKGAPANINLQNLQQLNVTNSQISASTQSGEAGNLVVNSADNRADGVRLDNGKLVVAAGDQGIAGSVTLNTRSLDLQNGSEISASNISADQNSTGGNITLPNLESLQVTNSTIQAFTQSGRAGNLNVNVTGRTLLRGSTLSVEATDKDGIAGNLGITTGTFRILEGSKITVSSPAGQAGNLTVVADDFRMDGASELSAQTGGVGNGANIDIQVLKTPLLMRNGSLISASANDPANGGNIRIVAPFLIGLTFENSDIEANAVQGRGGLIDITTNVIIGLQFRPKKTPFSDITASSQFGVSGRVSITVLSASDITKGIGSLPTTLVNVSNQITQSCAAGGQVAEKGGQFTIAGRGGVPASPTAFLPAVAPISDWVALEMSPKTPVGIAPSQGATSALNPASSIPTPSMCLRAWEAQQKSVP